MNREDIRKVNKLLHKKFNAEIKSTIGKNVAKGLNLIENPPYPITDPESQVQTVYW